MKEKIIDNYMKKIANLTKESDFQETILEIWGNNVLDSTDRDFIMKYSIKPKLLEYFNNTYYNNLTNVEEYILSVIETDLYIKAMENEDFETILDYIYGCDFDIEINENGTINLIDEQGAYLGGADSYENFEDIFEACKRLEGSFLVDYYGIEVW